MAGSYANTGGRVHDVDDERQSRASAPRSDLDPGATPIVAAADPRLAHAAPAGLMALQRSAGNAAVAGLVASRSVQRDVQIDEMTTSVGVADDAPAPAPGPAPGAGAGGPVTSDGATTTVTGGAIHLEAPMTTASGVLQVDTLIANSIVAASYSPGAGNVW